jgi:photosystem II stability/assembly factor-like uncharacterized protein
MKIKYVFFMSSLFFAMACSPMQAFRLPFVEEFIVPQSDFSAEAILISTEEKVTNAGGTSGSVRNRIYFSPDLGETWQELNRPENEYLTGYVKYLKVQDNTLFIGSHSGFSVAEKNGTLWKFIGNESSGYTLASYDDVVSTDVAKSGSSIYSATWSGLAISDNNALSWRKIPRRLIGSPSTLRSVYVISGAIYLTSEHALYVSKDNGMTWQEVNFDGQGKEVLGRSPQIVFLENEIFASSMAGGVFRSTDNGNSWQNLPLPNVLPNSEFVSGLLATENVLMAWSYLGYFRSTNRGASWTWTSAQTLTGLAKGIVEDISLSGEVALLKTNDFGNNNQKVFISKDSGATWTDLSGKSSFPKKFVSQIFVPTAQ